MAHLPLLLSCWAVCVTAFVALLIYRGHLTRHEVDVVHLSETDGRDDLENDSITARINTLQPFVQVSGGAAALCTLLVVGIYVASVLPRVHF